MAQVKPAVKGIIILIVAVCIIGGLQFANKKGLLNKIVPKKEGVSLGDPGNAKLDGNSYGDSSQVIKIGVVTWGGYAGGQYFNGGFNASETSKFFKEKGIKVEFLVLDDFKASRDAWKADKVNVLWGTADSFPTEIEGLKEYDPQIIFQADWSRGGDAIVVKHGINNVKQLANAKIAVALGTPSHSFLLNTFEAGGIPYNKDNIKTTDSAIAAAQMFKSGAVDAAVVWSPDDEDCVRSVTGSSILVSTKSAGNIIADIFFVKKKYLEANRENLKKLVEGWMQGASEVNNNSVAKSEAVKILTKGLKLDDALSTKSIENVRLCNYGDNKNFFGLSSGYKGVKGEDLYNKMTKLYSAIGLIKGTVPAWRTVVDSSLIQDITTMTSPGDEAEGAVKFKAPTEVEKKSQSFADKLVSVTYDSGSSKLTSDGTITIDMEFGDVARQFSQSRVRIEGNTDNVGSSTMNKKLSYARALSVADYLVKKYGFDKNRFIIVGNGPEKPVPGCEANDTEECKAKNRRTEFSLLK